MADLPSLITRMQMETTEFDRAADHVTKKVKELNDKLESTFKRMEDLGKKAALGLGAIAASMTGAVYAAAKLETSLMRLEAAVGGDIQAIQKLEATIKKLNASSADNEITIRNVTAQAYNMMSQFGFTADQVSNLVVQGEAFSTVWGTDLQYTIEQFLRGLDGTGRMLKLYGIEVDDVAIKQKMMEQGIGDLYDRMSEAEKMQMRYNIIMEATQNTMENSSKASITLENTIQRLKNSFIEATSRIGMQWLDDARDTLISIAEKIETLGQSDAFARLIGNLTKLALTITGVGVVIGILGKVGSTTLSALSLAVYVATTPWLLLTTAIVTGAVLMINNLDEITATWNNFVERWRSADASPESLAESWNTLVNAVKVGDWKVALEEGITLTVSGMKFVWEATNEVLDANGIKAYALDDWNDLTKSINEGDWLSAVKAAGQIGVDLIWGTATVLGQSVGSILNADMARWQSVLNEGMTDIKDKLAQKDFLGVLTAAGKMAVDLVIESFMIAGEVISNISEWLKTKVIGLLYPDSEAVDIGWIELATTAYIEIIDILKGGIEFAGGVVEKFTFDIANWVREKLGIEKAITANLGNDLTIILTGTVSGARIGLEWLTDKMSDINRQLEQAIQRIQGVGNVSEGMVLDADVEAISNELKAFGKAAGKFVQEGFRLGINLVDALSVAIEEAIEGLTGSETLGKIAGGAIPIYFAAKLTGLDKWAGQIMQTLLFAGIVRGGSVASSALGAVGMAAGFVLAIGVTFDRIQTAIAAGELKDAIRDIAIAAGLGIAGAALGGPVGGLLMFSISLYIIPKLLSGDETVDKLYTYLQDKAVGISEALSASTLVPATYLMGVYEHIDPLLELVAKLKEEASFAALTPLMQSEVLKMEEWLMSIVDIFTQLNEEIIGVEEAIKKLKEAQKSPIIPIDIITGAASQKSEYRDVEQLNQIPEYRDAEQIYQIPHMVASMGTGTIGVPVDQKAVDTLNRNLAEYFSRNQIEELINTAIRNQEKAEEELLNVLTPLYAAIGADATTVTIPESKLTYENVKAFSKGKVDPLVLFALARSESPSLDLKQVSSDKLGLGPFQMGEQTWKQVEENRGLNTGLPYDLGVTMASTATQAAEEYVDYLMNHPALQFRDPTMFFSGWNMGPTATKTNVSGIEDMPEETMKLMTRFMLNLEEITGGDWTQISESWRPFVEETAKTVNKLVEEYGDVIKNQFPNNELRTFDLQSAVQEAIERIEGPDEITTSLSDVIKKIEEIRAIIMEHHVDGYEAVVASALSAIVSEFVLLNDTAVIISNRINFIRDLLWQRMPVQGFSSGGFTSGSDSQVAGVVHGGEWVAPAWMVKEMPELFARLEGMRRGKGFAEGGPVDFEIPAFMDQSIDIFQPIMTSMSSMLKGIMSVVVKVGEAILNAVATIVEALGGDSEVINAIKASMKSLSDMTEEIDRDLSEVFKLFEEKQEEQVKAVEEISKIPMKSLPEGTGLEDAGFFERMFGGVFNPLRRKIEEAVVSLTTFQAATNSLKEQFNSVVATLMSGDVSGAAVIADTMISNAMASIPLLMNGIAAAFGAIEVALGPVGAAIAVVVAGLGLLGVGLFNAVGAVEAFKRGVSTTLGNALERLSRPFERLGNEIGRLLIPAIEFLVPVVEGFAIAIKNTINFMIDTINAAIEIINLIPFINLEKLARLGDIEQPEPEYESGNMAGWHQPVNNNFDVTFTGNTILDTDDEAMKQLWDKMIRYAKEHGIEVVV